MSGLVHPDRNRLSMAAVMAAAVAAGLLAGGWHVVRGQVDRLVDLYLTP